MSRSTLRLARVQVRMAHLAALAGVLSVSAHAGTVQTPGGSVTFAWGLDAEETETGTFQYVYPGDEASTLSTGGLRTATAGDAGRPTSIAQS